MTAAGDLCRDLCRDLCGNIRGNKSRKDSRRKEGASICLFLTYLTFLVILTVFCVQALLHIRGEGTENTNVLQHFQEEIK